MTRQEYDLGAMNDSTDHDVLIIGGGPSGASAAAILAEHGHRVLVLEREKFPRYHIGESLIPFTFAPLGACLMCQMSVINQLLGKKWWVGLVQAVALIAVLVGAGVLFATCGVAPGFALTTVFLTVILFATQFWLVHPLARSWSEP